MTDAGWAEKVAARKYGNKGWHAPYAAGLVSEHARAIRIVKAKIKYAARAEQKNKIKPRIECLLAGQARRGREYPRRLAAWQGREGVSAHGATLKGDVR